jgi:hypothetical protein
MKKTMTLIRILIMKPMMNMRNTDWTARGHASAVAVALATLAAKGTDW